MLQTVSTFSASRSRRLFKTPAFGLLAKADHVNPLALNLVIWEKEKGKGRRLGEGAGAEFECCQAKTKPWCKPLATQ